MKNISILVTSLLMVVSCQKKELQKENLSLNLPKGFEQTLIYASSTEGNSNGGMNDATEVKYRVDSVDKNSNYYITGEIMRMTFNQKMFGEEIHFDSRETSNTDDDGMGEEFKPMINNPFIFKIDKFGNILEKQKFTKEAADESALSQYNIIPFAFPRETVEEGFTWNVDTSNPVIKSIMPVTSNFTYKGTKNNKVEFVINSKMQGVEGIMKDTDIAGKYFFDSKTKALISAERNMPVQIGGGTATFSITPKIEGFN
ncbi:hypothetical protein SAMN05421846_111147 [Chryseobacterium taeanense]|uniref:Lipoprotein n=1 Tax=Chryseobacterium taeanense TaxID=311334 RepID=A0A1G8MIL3_9FLAO|nr:DUF6263 family protein [Chryseobacterium taeanense]SDI67695.1 hypothetical protein SAMN05421846_111147 [Chryseobacterium taeanense]